MTHYVRVPLAYVEATGGDWLAAALLAKLDAWMPCARIYDETGAWVAKTAREWAAELCASVRQVERAIALIKARGLANHRSGGFAGRKTTLWQTKTTVCVFSSDRKPRNAGLENHELRVSNTIESLNNESLITERERGSDSPTAEKIVSEAPEPSHAATVFTPDNLIYHGVEAENTGDEGTTMQNIPAAKSFAALTDAQRQAWDGARAQMELQSSRGDWSTHLQHLALVAVDGPAVTLSAPRQEIADYVNGRLERNLRRFLETAGFGRYAHLTVSVVVDAPKAPAAALPAAPTASAEESDARAIGEGSDRAQHESHDKPQPVDEPALVILCKQTAKARTDKDRRLLDDMIAQCGAYAVLKALQRAEQVPSVGNVTAYARGILERESRYNPKGARVA